MQVGVLAAVQAEVCMVGVRAAPSSAGMQPAWRAGGEGAVRGPGADGRGAELQRALQEVAAGALQRCRLEGHLDAARASVAAARLEAETAKARPGPVRRLIISYNLNIFFY